MTVTWKTLFAAWLALCALAAPAFLDPQRSGQGPQVTAQLDTGVVKLGSEVTCIVTVESAQQATLDGVPSVEGLPVVRTGGPSRRSFTSIFNGQVTERRTTSWTITFRPSQVGELVIPPMPLTVDGKEAFTRELTLSVVADLKGEELGHLAFVDAPDHVYEGQPFSLRLELGWDVALYENKPSSTEFFANLVLPWWDELPGTIEVDSGASTLSARVVNVPVNQRVVARAIDLGQREIRGRAFRVLSVTRSFVATRSGELDFPQSWLEFGRETGSLLRRQRETYYVGAPGFSIEVRTLPTDGQPFDFSKGVGHFDVTADVSRRDVDVGESIRLTVDWSGDANLEFFDPPDPSRLAAFEGFRSYGSTNDRFYGDRRRVVYDLAPLSEDIHEIPPLPLVVFDPEVEKYVTVSTPAIPIRVRPLEGAVGLTADGEEEGSALFTHDIQTEPESSGGEGGPGGGTVLGAWGSLAALWLASRTIVRRRGDPDAPAARRRRAARKKLGRELRGARTAGEQAQALFEFLGARSGELAEAWEGRDVAAWFRARELRVKAETASELAALTAELDRRHWAGDDAPLEPARVTAIADRLLEEGL